MKVNNHKYDPYILSAIGIMLPIWSIYFLYNNWNLQTILTVLILSLSQGIILTIFPHRAWAHKSWEPTRLLNFIGLFLYTIRLGGSSIGWVAVHRQHHRYADTEHDPHSPYHHSRFYIQWFPYFGKIKIGNVTDLLRDRQHIWFTKNFWTVNIVFLAVLATTGYLALWLAVLGINKFKMHCVNSMGHGPVWWSLPLNQDKSVNSLLLILMSIESGEGWHHNHHLNPANYSFSRAWWQIDPATWLLKLIFLLRLGKPKYSDLN